MSVPTSAATNAVTPTAIHVSSDSAGPVTAKERIASLDVLRGVALLGILPMNIQAFSMISAAYINPTVYGDLHGANYWVWFLCHLLADEKFMTIFSMLFGAGIFLMTSHIEAAGRKSAALHYRRMGWLILFGLLHAYLLWYGDILVNYGLCGLLAYGYRKATPRKLIIYGIAFIAVASLLFLYTAWTMPHWPAQQRESFTQQLWQPTPAMTASEVAAYRSGWLGEMRQRANDALVIELQGFLVLAFWRVEGLMLIGMALFKLGVFSARAPARVYWSFVAVALLIGFPAIIYGVQRDIAEGWDIRNSFFLGSQYNYWASILVALGWVGATMLVCQSPLKRLTRPLAAVGRMAFSNYILDTVICTSIFYGFGLGLFGKVSRVQQIEIVFAIWIVQLTISTIWLKYFQFGPLEWLWRSLTYWKRQGFRRGIALY
ncbi:MAG: DUF418 domain-containing protein [Candidatus Korobacteraceae bacterium]